MQQQDNVFKQIEPLDHVPSPALKKRVMSSIEFNKVVGDIFKVFSRDMTKSFGDLASKGRIWTDSKK